MAARVLDIQQLGTISFQKACVLQQGLSTARAEGLIPDMLLLMEHPHTFVLGHSSQMEQLLIDEDQRKQLGLSVCRADHRRQITYHGPGQMVAWAVLDLSNWLGDYHRYLDTLERILSNTLAHFQLQTVRSSARSSVWVPIDDETEADWTAKIATIDATISGGQITNFGFSLNVDPDLRFFDWIVPQDLHDCATTSIARQAPTAISRLEVVQVITETFCRAFEFVPRRPRIKQAASVLTAPLVSG
jgi:lipoyl(octanoyl) transferase